MQVVQGRQLLEQFPRVLVFRGVQVQHEREVDLQGGETGQLLLRDLTAERETVSRLPRKSAGGFGSPQRERAGFAILATQGLYLGDDLGHLVGVNRLSRASWIMARRGCAGRCSEQQQEKAEN